MSKHLIASGIYNSGAEESKYVVEIEELVGKTIEKVENLFYEFQSKFNRKIKKRELKIWKGRVEKDLIAFVEKAERDLEEIFKNNVTESSKTGLKNTKDTIQGRINDIFEKIICCNRGRKRDVLGILTLIVACIGIILQILGFIFK